MIPWHWIKRSKYLRCLYLIWLCSVVNIQSVLEHFKMLRAMLTKLLPCHFTLYWINKFPSDSCFNWPLDGCFMKCYWTPRRQTWHPTIYRATLRQSVTSHSFRNVQWASRWFKSLWELFNDSARIVNDTSYKLHYEK